MVYIPLQACFGECSQWGYWVRPRSAEGCLAAPGVRVSHSPLWLSARTLTKVIYLLRLTCFAGVPKNASHLQGGEKSPPFLFVASSSSRLVLRFRGSAKVILLLRHVQLKEAVILGRLSFWDAEVAVS